MEVATVGHDETVLDEGVVGRVGEVLSSGGLVVFPTETVYGIAAFAGSERGLEVLRAFKGRSERQPFTVHLPEPAAAGLYLDVCGAEVQRMIRKLFPGPVTLVADVAERVVGEKVVALGLGEEAGRRLYYENTIGLRCPDHAVARQVLGAVDGPVVASSANRHGEAPPYDAEEAVRCVGGAAAMVVDGGRCRYSKASTIIRARVGDGGAPSISVERAGVYDERFVRKLLSWTVVFVCTGNTCRSPMAAAIARDVIGEARGVSADGLEAAGVRVLSAGVHAASGSPASGEAVEALGQLGIDLSGHRSRSVTEEMVKEADVIYCMTGSHRQAVLRRMPGAEEKVLRLDPSVDVEDPVGSGLTTYQRCAELIRRRVTQRLKEQQQL